MADPDHGKIAAEINYIQKYKKYAQHTLVGSTAVGISFPTFPTSWTTSFFISATLALKDTAAGISCHNFYHHTGPHRTEEGIFLQLNHQLDIKL